MTQVASDAEGNIFIAGRNYVNNLTIGSDVVGYGAFVAKLDPDGNHLWAKAYGCDGEFTGIAVLPNGNVALSGLCGEYFVVTYGPSGSRLWSKTLGTAPNGRVFVASTPTNDVIVGGYVGFGSFDFGNGNIVGSGSDFEDVFAVKLNTQGTHQWSTVVGGTSTDYGFDVAVDAQGNSYVSASFFGVVSFGATTLDWEDGANVIIKLNPGGSVVWARQLDLGGNGDLAKRDLAVSPAGNIHMLGALNKDTDLGGGPLIHMGNADAFLLELDPAGAHLASSVHGGSETESATAPSFDSEGNLVFLFLGGSADFGAGTLLGSALVKLTGSGDYVWGRDQMPFVSTTTRPDRSVAAVGSFASSVNVGGASITTAGGTDIVVAVYEP